MKIKPMIGSGAPHTELAIVIKKIEDYFSEKYESAEDDNSISYPSCSGENCKGKNRGCLLEFFYYCADNGGYKNAIWIRINGNHKRWIYINAAPNTGAKRVYIASNPSLDVNNQQVTFQLPEAAPIPAKFNGGNYYIEPGHANANVNVITEIMNRLPVVCK